MSNVNKIVLDHACKIAGINYLPQYEFMDEVLSKSEFDKLNSFHPGKGISTYYTSKELEFIVHAKIKRVYHNADHICRVWSTLFNLEVKYNAAFATFALFHDVIYLINPKYIGHSERESWNVLRSNSTKIPEGVLVLAHEGILATARHTEDQLGLPIAVQYMLDADLIGLADSWDQYSVSSEAVRLESGLGQDDPKWVKNRGLFLQKMLDRKCIFYTDHFKEYEDKARVNMKQELADFGL